MKMWRDAVQASSTPRAPCTERCMFKRGWLLDKLRHQRHTQVVDTVQNIASLLVRAFRDEILEAHGYAPRYEPPIHVLERCLEVLLCRATFRDWYADWMLDKLAPLRHICDQSEASNEYSEQRKIEALARSLVERMPKLTPHDIQKGVLDSDLSRVQVM